MVQRPLFLEVQLEPFISRTVTANGDGELAVPQLVVGFSHYLLPCLETKSPPETIHCREQQSAKALYPKSMQPGTVMLLSNWHPRKVFSAMGCSGRSRSKAELSKAPKSIAELSSHHMPG